MSTSRIRERSARAQAAARAAAGVWLAALAACSGGSEPNPPPPPPPGPDGTRAVSVLAGDGQRAPVQQPVPVAPAVKVVNRSGAGVAGVAVTFAVGSGGGTVTGGAQTTGADGVATVGSWVLGAPGPNTLVATVAGATSGSPVTFTATGEEIVIEPSRDSTMTGVVAVNRFRVPPGVTVTVTDSLRIVADSSIEIHGTLRGACTPIHLEARQEVIARGAIDNGCAAADTAGTLRIVARGGYLLDSLALQSSGDVDVTNDPTLADQDFQPAPSPAAAASAAGQAALLRPCTLTNVSHAPTPARAPGGATSVQHAGRGRNGRTFRVSCRGNLQITGGVLLTSQHGGPGGFGFHQSASFADASGGTGGNGGDLLVRATGDIVVTGANELRSGDGGEGGRAVADGLVDPAGGKGANARALGRDGGRPGLVTMRAKGLLEFKSPTTIRVGKAGAGGDAFATGANGVDGGAQRAQHGGDADATAGQGGSSPDRQLVAGAGVINEALVTVLGGDAGDGGDADAHGGQGGKGVRGQPDGGNGGAMTATGGRGGDADTRDATGRLIGLGGWGGFAIFRGGNGGLGLENCSLPAVGPGGRGGAGGRGDGAVGRGGTGGPGAAVTRPDGIVELHGVGNGAKGGDGFPAGAPGTFGPLVMTGNRDVKAVPNSRAGNVGVPCVFISMQATSVTFDPPSGNPPPCEGAPAQFEVKSAVDGPVTFAVTTTNTPGYRVGPPQGQVPAANPPGTPFGVGLLLEYFDPCVAKHQVAPGQTADGTIDVIVTIGGQPFALPAIPVKITSR